MTTDLRPAASPLEHLGPQWFTPVMGWSGLALAWHRAAPSFGDSADIASAACALVALAIFLLVAAASLLRMIRHPAALAGDLAHPVRHAFAAAFPVSIIVLAASAVALAGPRRDIEVLWLAGVTLQAGITLWVVSRWLSGRLQWPGLTPVLYIPVVGNILVPLAGMPLGYPMLSWFFFGIGVFFWPVLTALLLARQVQQPLPDRLQAAWFITIAPPAVGGSAAASLGAGDLAMIAALGVATVFATAAFSRVPTITRSPFAMSAWATAFPLAALTALTLRASGSAPALALPGTVLLAVTSVTLGWLTLATVKGLRAGTLLVPEAVPVIPVVAAPN